MRETGDEERVSANWDVSSSQVSRQIGHVKPLKAGGGGRNTPRGVCVCVHVSFAKETCLGHSSKGGVDQVCTRAYVGGLIAGRDPS